MNMEPFKNFKELRLTKKKRKTKRNNKNNTKIPAKPSSYEFFNRWKYIFTLFSKTLYGCVSVYAYLSMQTIPFYHFTVHRPKKIWTKGFPNKKTILYAIVIMFLKTPFIRVCFDITIIILKESLLLRAWLFYIFFLFISF